jgi:hypothetical protein
LALTRSDTLKKAADLKKVVGRCEKEAGELFREFTPIATVAALSAKDESGEIIDQNAWDASLAAAFFEALDTSIALAQESCEKRDTIALTEPEKVAKAPVKKAAPSPRRKAAAKPAAPKAKAPAKTKPRTKEKAVKSNVSSLLTAVSDLRETKDAISSKDQFSDTLNHLFTTFLGDTDLSEAHQKVLHQMMSLERSNDVSPEQVLVQLEKELDDFADTAWCKLD